MAWVLIIYFLTAEGNTGMLHLKEFKTYTQCIQHAAGLERFNRDNKVMVCERVGDV